MAEPDFAGANRYAEARLRAELAPALLYHSVGHTCDEVVPAVRRLAGMLGVHGPRLALLETAAYFHDLGFVEQVLDHELIGVRVAQQVLPAFGFAPAQIRTVAGLILATRLPQSPHSLLERILADADLDVLGREDFWPRHAALRQELTTLGRAPSDAQWYCSQLAFLQEHRYFTPAARALRDAAKADHIRQLADLCAAARRGLTYDPTAAEGPPLSAIA